MTHSQGENSPAKNLSDKLISERIESIDSMRNNFMTHHDEIRESKEEWLNLIVEIKEWFKAREIDYGYTDTHPSHFATYIQEKISKALETERARVVELIEKYKNLACVTADSAEYDEVNMTRFIENPLVRKIVHTYMDIVRDLSALQSKEHE